MKKNIHKILLVVLILVLIIYIAQNKLGSNNDADYSDEEPTEEPITTTLDKERDAPKQTPTLYSGYTFALQQGQNVGNFGGLQLGKIADYVLPGKMKEDTLYLAGLWESEKEFLVLKDDKGVVVLDFAASSVNLVADNVDKSIEVDVFINGEYVSSEQAGSDVVFEEERAFVVVDTPQSYNIVGGEHGRYELRLESNAGLIFHAITFD